MEAVAVELGYDLGEGMRFRDLVEGEDTSGIRLLGVGAAAAADSERARGRFGVVVVAFEASAGPSSCSSAVVAADEELKPMERDSFLSGRGLVLALAAMGLALTCLFRDLSGEPSGPGDEKSRSRFLLTFCSMKKYEY